MISIHALREEGDLVQHSQDFADAVISIHALREEGDVSVTPYNGSMFTFLSTPSARRATEIDSYLEETKLISIHALREEGDDFFEGQSGSPLSISIHALREEGDSKSL